MIQLIVTGLGLGHLRPASGTWASLAAVVLGVLSYQCGAGWLVPLGAVLATVLGFWAVPKYLASRGDSDPSEVVIDELAGQWLAMSFTVIPLMNRGIELGFFSGAWPGWIVPFLLFRLFDIWKPWVIGKADRRGDAAGVMLDDLWAGLFAGLASVILAALYHVVLFA